MLQPGEHVVKVELNSTFALDVLTRDPLPKTLDVCDGHRARLLGFWFQHPESGDFSARVMVEPVPPTK